ncbi:hypothetical protein NDU88_000767 [Pleurodeles waltl]|uniref:Uncharacterized protein n=1 Tax=Pleurodeles waltl TaxID=8319 RepID=A0AAV7KPT9_PLEWA|nr:hypothetical protein NDU88_000767 [Pleurodeles waltl]
MRGRGGCGACGGRIGGAKGGHWRRAPKEVPGKGRGLNYEPLACFSLFFSPFELTLLRPVRALPPIGLLNRGRGLRNSTPLPREQGAGIRGTRLPSAERYRRGDSLRRQIGLRWVPCALQGRSLGPPGAGAGPAALRGSWTPGASPPRLGGAQPPELASRRTPRGSRSAQLLCQALRRCPGICAVYARAAVASQGTAAGHSWLSACCLGLPVVYLSGTCRDGSLRLLRGTQVRTPRTLRSGAPGPMQGSLRLLQEAELLRGLPTKDSGSFRLPIPPSCADPGWFLGPLISEWGPLQRVSTSQINAALGEFWSLSADTAALN